MNHHHPKRSRWFLVWVDIVVIRYDTHTVFRIHVLNFVQLCNFTTTYYLVTGSLDFWHCLLPMFFSKQCHCTTRAIIIFLSPVAALWYIYATSDAGVLSNSATLHLVDIYSGTIVMMTSSAISLIPKATIQMGQLQNNYIFGCSGYGHSPMLWPVDATVKKQTVLGRLLTCRTAIAGCT